MNNTYSYKKNFEQWTYLWHQCFVPQVWFIHCSLLLLLLYSIQQVGTQTYKSR